MYLKLPNYNFFKGEDFEFWCFCHDSLQFSPNKILHYTVFNMQYNCTIIHTAAYSTAYLNLTHILAYTCIDTFNAHKSLEFDVQGLHSFLILSCARQKQCICPVDY